MEYGLPAIPMRLHDRMLAWEYIDLAKLLPARAMPKDPPLATAGGIWLVQSSELIPEISAWVQCYAIYTSAVAKRFPDRVPAMLGYIIDITQTSRQLKWPSWVLSDASYRRVAVTTRLMDWS